MAISKHKLIPILTLTILFFGAVLPASSVVWAEENEFEVRVTGEGGVDKEVFAPGAIVEISGTAPSAGEVAIEVINPEDIVLLQTTVNTGADNSFFESLTLSADAVEGTYMVNVTQGDFSSEAEFKVGTTSVNGDEDDQEQISPSDVPDPVLIEALGAMPDGADVTGDDLVEVELEDGVYELEFKKAGQEYEVKVLWDGATVEVVGFEAEDDEADEPLDYSEDENGVTVMSSDNSVDFSNDEPRVSLKVKTETATLEEELEFEAKFSELVEFSDTNSDNIVDEQEEVFTLNLDQLDWTVTRTPDSPAPGDATITYVASTTIGDEPFDVEIEMVILQNDGADQVKATIKMGEEVSPDGSAWPFQPGADNKLALMSEVEAKFEAEAVELTPDAGATIDGTMIAIDTGTVVFQFTLESAIEVDGLAQDLPNAYTTEVEVETETETEGTETEIEAEAEMEAVAVYPHFVSSLVHDPSVGFIDDPVQVTAVQQAIQTVAGEFAPTTSTPAPAAATPTTSQTQSPEATPIATSSPTLTPTPAPTAARATPTPALTPAAAPSPTPEIAADNAIFTIGIIVAIVVAVASVAVALRRRKKT